MAATNFLAVRELFSYVGTLIVCPKGLQKLRERFRGRSRIGESRTGKHSAIRKNAYQFLYVDRHQRRGTCRLQYRVDISDTLCG
jgi:hypothetical protein